MASETTTANPELIQTQVASLLVPDAHGGRLAQSGAEITKGQDQCPALLGLVRQRVHLLVGRIDVRLPGPPGELHTPLAGFATRRRSCQHPPPEHIRLDDEK